MLFHHLMLYGSILKETIMNMRSRVAEIFLSFQYISTIMGARGRSCLSTACDKYILKKMIWLLFFVEKKIEEYEGTKQSNQ